MAYANLLPKERIRVGSYFIDVCRSSHKNSRAILLLHGIGVSGTYFLPFAEIIARHYDVRLIDMPGYGKTPRPDRALSPAELAEIVAEYLRKTKVSQVIIVGQSMGCQIAAQLAVRHPSLCEKVILIGPTVNKWERNLFLQGWRLLQDTFREPLGANKIIFRDYLRMGVLRYFQTSRHMLSDRLEEYVRDISIPVLIVRGSKDKIAPRRWASFLASRMKNAEVAEVPDAPHVVQFVKPKELFKICQTFLSN